MNNKMMINPANYYNPFAKYNYVSKTRGVYIPQTSEPLVKMNNKAEYSQKSTSIYSENYDAEADVMQCLKESREQNKNSGIIGFLNSFFGKEEKEK